MNENATKSHANHVFNPVVDGAQSQWQQASQNKF
jgi:hypothetical protein